MRFDLHMHTRRHSPDAETDPFELVQAAINAGLDGVVITEHDFLWPEPELEELRAAAPGLVILAGIEVTGRGGDVLCYGVTDPLAIPRGIAWPELCREVHRQGGACVAAHPNRWDQPFEKILRDQKPELDGIAEIIIAKQRNGPTGRIKLAFIKNSTRFESMAEGMSPPE